VDNTSSVVFSSTPPAQTRTDVLSAASLAERAQAITPALLDKLNRFHGSFNKAVNRIG
jgi:hypothetical protein